MEEWKDIYYTDNTSGKLMDFRGNYQVSSKGRIKSLKHGKEKILKLKNEWNGRKYVILSMGNKQYTLKVHRLVAYMFIPNPNNLPQVNHKDENPTNNCVENLEWCNAKYNNNYGTHNERMKNSKTGKINDRGGVVALNNNMEIIMLLSNCKYNIPNGFNHRHINECCNGKRKTHKGYIWMYKDTYELYKQLNDYSEIDKKLEYITNK